MMKSYLMIIQLVFGSTTMQFKG